jgi:hypothetical protein
VTAFVVERVAPYKKIRVVEFVEEIRQVALPPLFADEIFAVRRPAHAARPRIASDGLNVRCRLAGAGGGEPECAAKLPPREDDHG